MNQPIERPIRVLIVDDHAVVREGLRSFIATDPGIEVVGEAGDGIEAMEKARSLTPDYILLDVRMPRQDGIETLRQLNAEGSPAQVIILTSFVQQDQILQALKNGAKGYLLKESSPEQLIQALWDVHHGQMSLHPSVAAKVIGEVKSGSTLPPTTDPLTARELEVLKLIASGKTNRDIAEMIVVSERTVGSHVGNILEKLQLANRTQAALYALREGLSSLDEDQKLG
jgi:NarL family two-component system response regulator LiaR